jgi:hypothetical protein
MAAPEEDVAPETPDCTTVQEKVVPATGLLSATELAAPEQIAWEAGVAVAIGVGFIVITTTTGVPINPFAVGVIVKVAVPSTDPVAVKF